MTTYTEPARPLEFLVSEANGTISRENITLAASLGALDPGTVLGRKLVGAAGVATAYSGNTGNGVMGTVTVTSGAKVGNYKLTIDEAGTNVGHFVVEDPDGIFVGQGDVAAAFSAGGLSFTLADGSTDFAAGDGFTIAVTATGYAYGVYDNTATDGLQTAVAILGYAAANVAATQTAMVIARHAEVFADELDWGSNDAAGITQGTADLAKLEILVRAA